MVGDQNLCAANQGHKFKTGTQESDLAQGSVAPSLRTDRFTQ